jgi:U4/U6 small nuclear ribonucleoprotein PRP31
LTVKKRRGGRKMRQLKERFEETALMKQANTRAFSAQTGEYGDDAMGLTMGLLDTAQEGGSGNVRKNMAEKRKMRQTNTKATRKRAAQMARYSSAAAAAGTTAGGAAASSATSGLASTISFTPMQAMELVNPDAQNDRVRQANLKWFSDSAGFQSAAPPPKK